MTRPNPEALIQTLRQDLYHADYHAPVEGHGSAAEWAELHAHVTAVLWRVNDWANQVGAYVKDSAHCSFGTVRFDAGISDIGLQELGDRIKAAQEAAEAFEAEAVADARSPHRYLAAAE